MQTQTMDGAHFTRMLQSGLLHLERHKQEIDALNVFPIPDGDTGENMYLTFSGGVQSGTAGTLGEVAGKMADGMLLSARGNSGVILSQIAAGVAEGLHNADTAAPDTLRTALRCGVEQAYKAVMEPTEGTMLTVYRCAVEAVENQVCATTEDVLRTMLDAARETLAHTPEMLPVLAKAGVVDSGGAGLVAILEGMLAEDDTTFASVPVGTSPVQDLDRFGADSVLTYGYCTELLLRLQNCKTDVAAFDTDRLTEPLQQIGDSMVIWRKDSLLKLHIHTKTPDKVLALCQQYGEFLQVKIENMSLQHSNTMQTVDPLPGNTPKKKDHTPYGVVAVASGDGIRQLFLDRGADVLVEGGQTNNPSTEDFLEAFDRVNADTIFVLPNNGNILLTAMQAATMYPKADVRVIETRTLGEGVAALSMLSYDTGDTDAIVQELTEATEGVVTAAVSQSVRETAEVHTGEYLGFVGKEILTADPDRLHTACNLADALSDTGEVWLLLVGKGVPETEAAALERYITKTYPAKEVYRMDGGQEIYDYMMILE